jgi:bacillopeptidase F
VKSASASGGSFSEAHLAGASASFAFTGTSVTWQTVTGPNQGEAYVYVDNVLKASVNNYAKTTTYKVARSITGLSGSAHVVKIVVRGVKGSTVATDTQVAVDDFMVGSAVTQESGSGVTYSWAPVSAAAATGGAYAADDLAGAKYLFSFRGTGVKWLTVLGPNMGEAAVYIDGVLKGTFNNYAAKLTYQASHSLSGLTDAPHTLQIVVLGKHTATSKGSQVAVDGFVVS